MSEVPADLITELWKNDQYRGISTVAGEMISHQLILIFIILGPTSRHSFKKLIKLIWYVLEMIIANC